MNQTEELQKKLTTIENNYYQIRDKYFELHEQHQNLGREILVNIGNLNDAEKTLSRLNNEIGDLRKELDNEQT